MTALRLSRRSLSAVLAPLAALLRAAPIALALATAAGLASSALRPGTAVHPLWMGTLGATPLDTLLAGAFSVAVLFRRTLARRFPRAYPAAALLVAAVVVETCVVALVRHAIAVSDGALVATRLTVPFAFVGLAIVVGFAIAVHRPLAPRPSGLAFVARCGAVAAAGVALLALEIAAIGATDYRAPADVAIVLGSKVHPDGTPSGSLIDRTHTACDLYRAGLVRTIVLSGGHTPGLPVGEPEAMATICREQGVPDVALVLDPTGFTSAASMHTAADLARRHGWRRVLVVSHDYHLARLRLLAAREGLDVRTVPARETVGSRWKAVAFPREVAAYAAAWVLGDVL